MENEISLKEQVAQLAKDARARRDATIIPSSEASEEDIEQLELELQNALLARLKEVLDKKEPLVSGHSAVADCIRLEVRQNRRGLSHEMVSKAIEDAVDFLRESFTVTTFWEGASREYSETIRICIQLQLKLLFKLNGRELANFYRTALNVQYEDDIMNARDARLVKERAELKKQALLEIAKPDWKSGDSFIFLNKVLLADKARTVLSILENDYIVQVEIAAASHAMKITLTLKN